MLCDTAFHILTCTMFCIFALRFVVSIFVLVGNCFPLKTRTRAHRQPPLSLYDCLCVRCQPALYPRCTPIERIP
jgi:hypothetical protein